MIKGSFLSFPFEFGAPGRIRTRDPLVRSQVLYPTELPARKNVIMHTFSQRCKSCSKQFFLVMLIDHCSAIFKAKAKQRFLINP